MPAFIISVPILRRLTSQIKDESHAAIRDCNVTINTRNLEHLSIFDYALIYYLLENLHRVRYMHIRYGASCLGNLLPDAINHPFELFKGIVTTKLLKLHSCSLNVSSFHCISSLLYVTSTIIGNILIPFCANKDELQGAKCLLKNAQMLELIVIGYPYMDKEVVKKLIPLPRASMACHASALRLNSQSHKIKLLYMELDLIVRGTSLISKGDMDKD
ncbi:hypothetical protein Cgig2_010653 [Carnegiea gigantea]|uniref:FBD domain-containing protein n=1 Tax=Carnegiea gigantea TaxID=171969 RepID=A0A9Q1GRV1_9CARY|nr:hypothetical protein Cgig2_010653 [Carnegiea gigantea]